MSDSDSFESREPFASIVEQWSRSQMDSALASIARYDDAAKQLIGLGGVLQGVYFAVFMFGNLSSRVTYVGALLVFVPLVLMILCAAQSVCRVHLGASAMTAYRLFRDGRVTGVPLTELDRHVDRWCGEIDRVAAEKRRWVHYANVLLVVATISGLATLTLLMMGPTPR